MRESTPFERAVAEASALGEGIILSLTVNEAIRSIWAEERRATEAAGGAPSYYDAVSIGALWSHIAHEAIAEA